MMGLEMDGAIAEFAIVSEDMLYPIPDAMSWRLAAFLEPITAALAIGKADIKPGQKGIVAGESRFAKLARLVLEDRGYVLDADGPADFAIETGADPDGFAELMRQLKPGGLLVLKSRPCAPVTFDLNVAVRQELRFEAVQYGCFREAIDFAMRYAEALHALFGRRYPLDDYADAFAAAKVEAAKVFIDLGI
jgi:L-iditol 2-dehydrogenase